MRFTHAGLRGLQSQVETTGCVRAPRYVGFCSGLIRATLHMVNREFGELAADFISLGLLPPGADRDAIVPALTSACMRPRGSSMPQQVAVPYRAVFYFKKLAQACQASL